LSDAVTPGRTKPNSRLITAFLTLASIALVSVVLLLFLPRVVSYEDVWRAFRDLSWLELAAVLLTAVLNLLTYGPALMAALPGIGYGPALTTSLAASASTYIAPGGPTVGLGISFLMLRAWGFARRRITLALGLVTIGNQLATLAFPPVALVILLLTGERNPLLETVSVVGLLLLALVATLVAVSLYSEALACRVGDATAAGISALFRLLRRPAVRWSGQEFARFRSEAVELLEKRWHWLTLGTLAGHLSVFLVLVVTLRAVGVSSDDVSVEEAFAGWSVIRVLGAIPILPGGFGVVEVGLTTALVGFGGREAGVVASVVVYRFLTVGVPLVCGAIAGALWRRHHPREAQELRATGVART
jgi:putative heme transporter